jgi:hypothetical protein
MPGKREALKKGMILLLTACCQLFYTFFFTGRLTADEVQCLPQQPVGKAVLQPISFG